MSSLEFIGKALKEARTRKSITLEEVHAKIKIHPRVLQLLEESKFDKLPSPLFVKSFLRSYAQFLEISSEELIQAYEKDGAKEPEQTLFIKPTEHREKIQSRQKAFQTYLAVPLTLVAIALAGIFIVYSFKTAASFFSKRAQQARKSESPTRKDKSASVEAEGVFDPKSGYRWARSTEMGNFPKVNRKTQLSLQLKALDNVWVRITCDDKVLFQSILKKGTVEKWTARSDIEIWTGNASNMSLVLNGYSLGSPGKGVVKRMVITHEGVKIAV